jgi:hypothetical protein
MVQENPTKDRRTILILGTMQSERQDFFSKINSFSLFTLIEKDGRTILNIPAWPVLVALATFLLVRAIRSRQS